jgi:hypothetical protein
MVGAGLFVTTGAGAQTTTTTSSSTTSSTVAVTTTMAATTTTTVANPCAGQPCTVDPPVATLSGSGGETPLSPLPYCWRAPTSGTDGPVTRCATPALALDIPVGLVVRQGETLTLRFGIGMSPTQVVLARRDQPTTALTPGNPTVFVADLPVGQQLVSFVTTWLQGEATYLVKLDVRAAAVPTTSSPRPLALTG